MLSATPRDEAEPSPAMADLEVIEDGGVVVLVVRGDLDARAGKALETAVAAAAARPDQVVRVDVDLRAVESFTPEGASALLCCRDLTDVLTEGLHYRTGRGPGREALLAAYARSTLPPGV